ncbi:alditol oxidase [soil metagenome]
MRNWAGNFEFQGRVERALDVATLQALVVTEPRLKPFGMRHSFTQIANTDGVCVDLSAWKGIEIDASNLTGRVQPGVTYAELGAALRAKGLAVPNYASLPHVTIVGVVMTSTHGSGISNPSLSISFLRMEMVDGAGELVSTDANPSAMTVSLGALGIVTSLELQVVPEFEVFQKVYLEVELSTSFAEFSEVMGCGYSVSLFTDWSNTKHNQLWVKSKSQLPDQLFGKAASLVPCHPVPGMEAENCTVQLGIPGPSAERLPHFKSEFMPSAGEELQSEFIVERSLAIEAIAAIRALGAEITPLLYVGEIRTVAQDSFWMSPFYERDAVAFHFTWKPEWEAVRLVLAKIEAALPTPRPHMGKLFTMDPAEVMASYPRSADFGDVVRAFDPEGKFRNPFLDSLLGAL